MSNRKASAVPILYSSFLCMGLLLLADAWIMFSPSPVLIAAAAFVFQLLIYYTEEKKLRIPFWSGLAVLTAFAGVLLPAYRERLDMEACLSTLGTAAAAAVLAALCHAAADRPRLKTVLFLLQSAGLVLTGVRGIFLPKWEVFVILCGTLLFLSETAAALSGKKNAARGALSLAPFFAAALLVLLFLPVKNTPIRWTAVKEAVKFVREKANALAVYIEYLLSEQDGAWSLSFSGYDSDGVIGGNVFLSDRPQIAVCGGQTKSPLYLAGNRHDVYTGSGWETRAKKRASGKAPLAGASLRPLTDALQTCFTDEEMREITRTCTCTVTYEGLKTESLFCPPCTERILLPEKVSLTGGEDGGVRLSRAKGVGFSYQIQFLEVNWADERIRQFLRGRTAPDPHSSGQSSGTGTADEEELSLYENDTLLPASLPGRVRTLAEKLTENEQNDYDRLKAIEAWLNSSFTYTTSPPSLPEGADAVDWFLFESTKGYCTHFASAMAVLARCVGIPTRYVEGFATTSTCVYNNRTLHLTGRNAHAWAEAYLPGVGWIPLEPTPGYYEPADAEWAPAAKAAPGSLDTAKKPEPADISPAAPLSQAEASPSGRTAQLFIRYGKIIVLLLLAIAAAAAALLCIFLLIAAVRRFVRDRSYRSMSGGERIRQQMKAVLAFGRLCGMTIEEGETLSGYESRLKGRLDTVEADFSFFCERYQKIRFEAVPASEQEIAFFERYTILLRRQYMESCGLLKRLLFLLSNLY